MKLTVFSGNLITFVQFAVTALLTWPTHFSASQPPFFLKPRAIPIVRWLPYIALFFTVNFLNNYAFGYNISVPVHIILRSGGSVTTMLVGFIWGKRYTPVQIMSVAMLTVGIIVAAMADARSKVGPTSTLIHPMTRYGADQLQRGNPHPALQRSTHPFSPASAYSSLLKCFPRLWASTPKSLTRPTVRTGTRTFSTAMLSPFHSSSPLSHHFNRNFKTSSLRPPSTSRPPTCSRFWQLPRPTRRIRANLCHRCSSLPCPYFRSQKTSSTSPSTP